MEPNTETSRKISRIGGMALKVIMILFSVMAVYLVLFPIVVWICMRLGVLEMGGDYPILDVIGAPIEWLVERFPPYTKLMTYISELILP